MIMLATGLEHGQGCFLLLAGLAQRGLLTHIRRFVYRIGECCAYANYSAQAETLDTFMEVLPRHGSMQSLASRSSDSSLTRHSEAAFRPLKARQTEPAL